MYFFQINEKQQQILPRRKTKKTPFSNHFKCYIQTICHPSHSTHLELVVFAFFVPTPISANALHYSSATIRVESFNVSKEPLLEKSRSDRKDKDGGNEKNLHFFMACVLQH